MSDLLFALMIFLAYCGAVMLAVLTGAFLWFWFRDRHQDKRPGFIDDRVLQGFLEDWTRDYYAGKRGRL